VPATPAVHSTTLVFLNENIAHEKGLDEIGASLHEICASLLGQASCVLLTG
jgi:hypothetical protein